jgi:hypothetical protein
VKTQSHLLVLTAFLSLSATSCGKGVNTFDSPEHVLNTLKSGSTEAMTRTKQELHMPPMFIKNCENGDATLRDLELRPAVLEDGMKNAIITAKCGYSFLVITLVQEKSGKWRYQDSMPLSAVYDTLTVTLQPIVNPPVQEVVVHGHVPAHGTGIYQADFVILKVIDGHIRAVLDEIEQSHLDPPNGTAQPAVMQESTFNVRPKTSGDSASVIETQTLTVSGKSTVSEREFDWDDNLHIFEVGFWETSKPTSANHK